MRVYFRLLIVVVLVFVTVGFALVYSRDDDLRSGIGAFASETWGSLGRAVSEVTDPGALPPPDPYPRATELRLLRPNQTTWMGLTGFPDRMEIRFPIPQTFDYLVGDLRLKFDVQLAEGVDGLLSVRVNGKRKGEILLSAGSGAYDFHVPLDDNDLLMDNVLVELAARGNKSGGEACPSDVAEAGITIALLPESVLVLRTPTPMDAPESALILMTDPPLRVDLGLDKEAQTYAIWAAQKMERSGVGVRLVDDPLAERSIRIVPVGEPPISFSEDDQILLSASTGVDRAIAFHRAYTPEPLGSWPVSVAALGTETIAQNFRGSRRWAVPYKIANLPQGLTPTRFELSIRASRLAEDFEWVLRVLLNGNLLQSVRYPGNDPDMNLEVDLPIDMQGLANTIVVELVDTSPNTTMCRAGAEAEAQLLPQSALRTGGTQPREGWGDFIRKLADAPNVRWDEQSLLTVSQASRAAAMLTEFLPIDANVASADGPGYSLSVLDRQQLEATFAAIADGTFEANGPVWLITDARISASTPLSLFDLMSADADAILASMYATDIAFLVRDTAP